MRYENMARHNITSGSSLENPIGFSRAVRIGPYIAVSGTAPIAPVQNATANPNASVYDVRSNTRGTMNDAKSDRDT